LGTTEPNKANNTLTKTVNVIGPSVKIIDASGNDITGKIIEVKVGQKWNEPLK
jgi:uncharacterized protein YnzC (UPF0291/DUF896 family)